MDGLIQKLKALSSANEFLEFFGVEYDEAVVHVNRLHILKRFYQYLHRAQDLDGLNEIDMFRRYREFLVQAYTDFTTSNAATEKVFKVFQDTDGKQHVTVDSLRSSLGARRAA
ncbi:MAG: nitrogenase stabilizing/protective protein NifW [Burkholderiaceae bacterium]